MRLKWMNAAKSILLVEKDDAPSLVVEPNHRDWTSYSGMADIEDYVADPDDQRAAMICTRAQGKLAIGPEIWAQVVALADDPETPWGLRVAVHDTYEWRRLDPNMDALIWAMQLTPEEADDLFRLAMTL